MIIEIRKSFEKDTIKLPLRAKLQISKIIDRVIKAENLEEISSCKKMVGYKTAYRIRMGADRIGIFYEKNTVEFTRVLGRKDIYTFFP